MRVEEGSQMSSGLSSMFSFFTWTNTFYILIYLTSLSDCEVSNFHSQMSSSSSQRHSEKYTTSFSEARASALQAAPPESSPCPEGYVIDRFNNNECVKRFVPPKPKACPEPNIRFGGFEMMVGGRMSQFWCEDGWDLAPATSHAMCKLGKWDRAIPICVRPGCEELTPPNQVSLTYEMDMAIARFECNQPWPQLELIGNDVLSCDGVYWNGTMPECRKPPPPPKPKNEMNREGENGSTSSSNRIFICGSDFRTRLLISACGTYFSLLHYFFYSKM